MKQGSGVKIMLDKERTLRWDFNAQESFEDATGENTLDGVVFFKKPFTAKRTKVFIWSCLLHEDETLTLKQVGAMLSFRKAEGAAKAIVETIKAAYPDPSEEEVEEDGGKNENLPTG